MDYSTIDIEKLKQLPTFRLPGASAGDVMGVGKWSIQKDPGNGCFLDAPGYPSYFTRSVYHGGDYPRSGPVVVITYEGVHYVIATYDDEQHDTDERLKSLWKPLPLAHKRVQQWLREVHRHMAHCYVDDNLTLDGKDRTFIYPVPKYKLKHFVNDPRFSDEWRSKAIEEVDTYNEDVVSRTQALAVPENHQASRTVWKFYPDYVPVVELMAWPPKQVEGLWWETEAEQPTPAACKPRNGIGHATHEGAGWCQWCGWRGKIEFDNTDEET